MNSILDFNQRGNFGSSSYRGNCSGKTILALQKRYKFDSISDYMRGSNTTGDAANFLKIQSNTYDLNMGFDLLKDTIPERNTFTFFHPPYWNIIKYSGEVWGNTPHPSDLSQITDYKDFIKALDYCIAKQFASLKTGGRMAILIADIKNNWKIYSPYLDYKKIGTIEDVYIKVQNNCMSDSKNYENNDFTRIAHEYLIVLRKDNPYLYNMKITKDYTLDIRDNIYVSWKDLVASVLEKLKGKASLDNIYKQIEGHMKALKNPHWKEKIRQTLQRYINLFKSSGRGIWQLIGQGV